MWIQKKHPLKLFHINCIWTGLFQKYHRPKPKDYRDMVEEEFEGDRQVDVFSDHINSAR